MALIKTLIKHGTSRAIIIDRSILELLNIADQTPLQLDTDGKRLIITPLREDDDQARKRKIREASEAINKKYRRAFEKLSEGPGQA